MQRLFLLCVMLLTLQACGTGCVFPYYDSVVLYEDASSLAVDGKFVGAFDVLDRSMSAGYPTPSDVLRSDKFRTLLDSSQWRPRVYELLKSNAREHSISMVHPDELGEPMTLTIHIVAGQGKPTEIVLPHVTKAGLTVGIVQVNAAGYYQPWTKSETWNPRLFGFASTDNSGTVVVRTVRPGHYAQIYEAPEEPMHIHYNIEHNGEVLRGAEIYFEDDPRLIGEALIEAKRKRVSIATIFQTEHGVWQAEVTIPVLGLR